MYQAARFGVEEKDRPTRDENPPRLFERGVGVDQVLYQLAHDHDVDAAGAEGKPWSVDRCPSHG